MIRERAGWLVRTLHNRTAHAVAAWIGLLTPVLAVLLPLFRLLRGMNWAEALVGGFFLALFTAPVVLHLLTRLQESRWREMPPVLDFDPLADLPHRLAAIERRLAAIERRLGPE